MRLPHREHGVASGQTVSYVQGHPQDRVQLGGQLAILSPQGSEQPLPLANRVHIFVLFLGES